MELIVCTPKNLIDIIRKEDAYDEDRVHPLTDLNFLILDEVLGMLLFWFTFFNSSFSLFRLICS
jgi:hypothetical protein